MVNAAVPLSWWARGPLSTWPCIEQVPCPTVGSSAGIWPGCFLKQRCGFCCLLSHKGQWHPNPTPTHGKQRRCRAALRAEFAVFAREHACPAGAVGALRQGDRWAAWWAFDAPGRADPGQPGVPRCECRGAGTSGLQTYICDIQPLLEGRNSVAFPSSNTGMSSFDRCSNREFGSHS